MDNQPDEVYTTIIPDISDDTMKTKDVGDLEQDKTTKKSKPVDTQQKKITLAKKVFMVLLSVVILILIVILIYQIYIYYNDGFEEEPPKPPKYRKKTNLNNAKNSIPKKEETIIPDSVKNMDDDVLSQFIKKDKSKKEVLNYKNIVSDKNKKSALDGLMVDDSDNSISLDKSDTDYINELIDVDNKFIDKLPSKKDMVKMMNDEMKSEINDENRVLHPRGSVEPNNINDIVNIAEEIDEEETPEEGYDTCIFNLTMGKNAGKECGRKTVGGNNHCQRHLNKRP